MSKSFDSFAALPITLQKEALREAEERLKAQMTVANAADQRALVWSGFLIASATAAIGATVALSIRSSPNYGLVLASALFGIGLLAATWLAIMTVYPEPFSLVGNRPEHWLPEIWQAEGITTDIEQLARNQQAEQMDGAITRNAKMANDKGADMRQSIIITVYSTAASGIIVFLALLLNFFALM